MLITVVESRWLRHELIPSTGKRLDFDAENFLAGQERADFEDEPSANGVWVTIETLGALSSS